MTKEDSGPNQDPIADYLSKVPDDMRSALEEVNDTIVRTAPDAAPGFSYGMPTYRYMGRPLVGFAAFKKHLSFFPMGSKVLDALGADVELFRTSKGTLQFTPDNPLPTRLVVRIVKGRMREIEEKGRSRR